MKLIGLELKNFRQHLDTVVTFTDGVTGIIGPNGSGKTTILEAISWALYGAPAVRGTNDTIRSKASEGGAKVSVNLTFELGGSIYRAVRTLDGSGRSGGAVLEVDGRPLRSGMSEVSEAITKLLGMDYRAFFTSFFTNQKAIEFMAALDGRARANAISKMLGYDRVTRAREQANEDRKALHNQIEGLERGLPDPEELKERRKTAQAQLAGAKSSLEMAEESQKAAQEVFDKLKPLKDASDQKARRFDDVSRRLELDRAELASMSDRLKQLTAEQADLEVKRAELEALKPILDRYEEAGREYKQLKELQEHEGERQRLTGQIEAVDGELRKLEPRFKQLVGAPEQKIRANAALTEAEAMLAQAEKNLQQAREQAIAREHSLQAHVKQLESQLAEVQAKREQIEKAGPEGICPTCERPLADELLRVLANFRDQMEDLSSRIEASSLQAKSEGEQDRTRVDAQQLTRDSVASQVEQFRAESASADALVAEYEMIRQQIEIKRRDLDTYRAGVAALPGGFDQARFREVQRIGEELRPQREKAVGLKSALERCDAVAREIAEMETSIQARLRQISEAEKILAELAFSPEDRDKLVREFEEANTALNAALVILERQRGEVGTATAILTAAEREQEAYNSKVEQLKKNKLDRQYLQTLAEALDKLRADLNDRIRPELETISSELLSMMTDGRYNTLEISEDYKPMIRDDGELKPVISGGEDDIVNLALRLAISQMIADRAGQSFSLLVLDEVFGSLDDSRRDNVVSLLQNLKNRFEQIILITHVESIHDALDNCLWVEFDERTKTSRLVDRAIPIEV